MKNVVLAAVVAAMVFGASAAGALDFTSHTMHAGGKLQAVERHDVNGDGLVDLVVSVSTGAPPEARRSVAVFLAREGAAFSGEPDFSVNAPSDACAFDLADLDDDGKAELLFFFRWSVTALSIGENGFGKPEKILDRGADAFFPDEERLPAIDLAKKLARRCRGGNYSARRQPAVRMRTRAERMARGGNVARTDAPSFQRRRFRGRRKFRIHVERHGYCAGPVAARL
ncbi:MAG: FG-GAP-like repeat-containing protein [Deltaproteobacteria bacterium]|nr:FG-GAP-like repeat-containing protein [Deltaproteobacteria bacterium]